MGGDSTKVQAPKLSFEEKQLIEQQRALLAQQMASMTQQSDFQEMLMPALLESMGLRPVFGSPDPTINTAATENIEKQRKTAFDRHLEEVRKVNQGSASQEVKEAALKELTLKHNKEIAGFDRALSDLRNPSAGDIVGFEKIPESQAEIQKRELREQLESQLLQSQLDALSREEAFAPRRQELEERLLNEQIAAVERESELAPERQEIEQLQLDRSIAALRGELPVDPALLRDLDEQEQKLRDQLRKQLGTGFETSTPGIEALSEFGNRRSEILERVRRGDIEAADRLRTTNVTPAIATANTLRPSVFDRNVSDVIGVSGLTADLENVQFQQLFGGSSAIQAMGSGTNASFGQISQQLSNLSSIFADQRHQRFQAELASQDPGVDVGRVMLSAMLGAVTGGASAGLTAGVAGLFSG